MSKTILSLLLAACCLPASLPAAHAADAAKKDPAAVKCSGAVAEALKDIPFITEKKPNLKAKYYVYLMSASWCAACNVEMPHVVEQYKEMARKKVEIVYVNGDKTPEEASAFMKKYKADFPCILIASQDTQKLPGFKRIMNFPWAIVVDADGNVLQSARADKVFNAWRQTTGTPQPKKRKK